MGTWNYSGAEWRGSGCGNDRMLLSDDWICSDKF